MPSHVILKNTTLYAQTTVTWMIQYSKCSWKYYGDTDRNTFYLEHSHRRHQMWYEAKFVCWTFLWNAFCFITLWAEIRVVVKLHPSSVFLTECIHCDTGFLYNICIYISIFSITFLLFEGRWDILSNTCKKIYKILYL